MNKIEFMKSLRHVKDQIDVAGSLIQGHAKTIGDLIKKESGDVAFYSETQR